MAARRSMSSRARRRLRSSGQAPMPALMRAKLAEGGICILLMFLSFPLFPSFARAQQAWAVRVAESVMRRSPVVVYDKWDYTAGLMLVAFQRIGDRTHDPKYAAYVKRSVDSLVHPDGSIATYSATEFNLDQINEGRALF